jgi:hypothetical protein
LLSAGTADCAAGPDGATELGAVDAVLGEGVDCVGFEDEPAQAAATRAAEIAAADRVIRAIRMLTCHAQVPDLLLSVELAGHSQVHASFLPGRKPTL